MLRIRSSLPPPAFAHAHRHITRSPISLQSSPEVRPWLAVALAVCNQLALPRIPAQRKARFKAQFALTHTQEPSLCFSLSISHSLARFLSHTLSLSLARTRALSFCLARAEHKTYRPPPKLYTASPTVHGLPHLTQHPASSTISGNNSQEK